VPADVGKWPAPQRDPDGFFAADRATLSVMGYNTKLVKPEDLPKTYEGFLDKKDWSAASPSSATTSEGACSL